MRSVFVDSSFYLALLNPSDEFHSAAKTSGTYRGTRVTTEFVLLEVGNSMSHVATRNAFIAFVQFLRADVKTRIVAAERDLFARGMNLYTHRPDKNWSVTDCISMVVMDDQGIQAALTTDHHFEQAGFQTLLK